MASWATAPPPSGTRRCRWAPTPTGPRSRPAATTRLPSSAVRGDPEKPKVGRVAGSREPCYAVSATTTELTEGPKAIVLKTGVGESSPGTGPGDSPGPGAAARRVTPLGARRVPNSPSGAEPCGAGTSLGVKRSSQLADNV